MANKYQPESVEPEDPFIKDLDEHSQGGQDTPFQAPSFKDQLKEFDKLTRVKGKLEKKLDYIKRRLERLEPDLMSEMADLGMQSASVNKRTYYVYRSLFAGPSVVLAEGLDDMERDNLTAMARSELCAVLETMDETRDFVRKTFNSQTFSKWVREYAQGLTDNGMDDSPEAVAQALPGRLRGLVKVTEKFGLRSRKK